MKLNLLNRDKLGYGKDLLIITDIDLDGISGAVLASLKFPLAKIYHTRTNIAMELLESGHIYDFTSIMFIDCSPKTQEDYNTIKDIFGIDNMYIFDHHESLKKIIPKGGENEFNVAMEYCGCSLFWNALFGSPDDIENISNDNIYDLYLIGKFVFLVNVYDMWLDKEEDGHFLDAKTLNMKFNYLGIDKYILYTKKYLNGEIDDIIPSNLKDGFIYYMQQINSYIDKKCNEAYIVDEEAITFAEDYKSEIGNQLLNKYKGKIKRAIVVDVSKNSISIRSKDNSALDKANRISYLSGGHLNAAGARIEGLKKEIIDMIANK